MSLILTLIGIALVLFFFEILIPGGLLAILGVLLMFGACVVAYIEMGVMAAIITFLLSMIFALLMLILELKIIPKTRFGQRLFHKSSLQETSLKEQAGNEIIGKEGETRTRLNPTGMIVVEGVQYEAFSQSGLLDKGTPIKVVNQDSFRLIVDKV